MHGAIKIDDIEPIWRLGGVLGAMAASVLIVSGVWLTQIPKPQQQQTARTATPPQNWERIAVNLRVDPFPVNDRSQTEFAKADLTELKDDVEGNPQVSERLDEVNDKLLETGKSDFDNKVGGIVITGAEDGAELLRLAPE